jgi:hypothetical protein
VRGTIVTGWGRIILKVLGVVHGFFEIFFLWGDSGENFEKACWYTGTTVIIIWGVIIAWIFENFWWDDNSCFPLLAGVINMGRTGIKIFKSGGAIITQIIIFHEEGVIIHRTMWGHRFLEFLYEGAGRKIPKADGCEEG